jgi:nucleoside-diphosphate-sugar epimerase
MKKVAILGATGFIGKSLAMEFLKYGESYQLVLFSRSISHLTESFNEVSSPHILTTLDTFSHYDYDIIVNASGYGSMTQFKDSPEQIMTITETMDTLALTYLATHSSTQYISLSSGAVHSPPQGDPTTVKDFYALAKLEAEKRHRLHPQFSIIDIRIFSFFSQYIDLDSHFLITDIIRSLQNKTTLETTEENIVRDYICPSDLFELLTCCIAQSTLNIAVDAYSKAPVTKIELLDCIKENYGLIYTVKPREEGGIALSGNSYYATDKTAETLGYFPKETSLTGIDRELQKLLRSSS